MPTVAVVAAVILVIAGIVQVARRALWLGVGLIVLGVVVFSLRFTVGT